MPMLPCLNNGVVCLSSTCGLDRAFQALSTFISHLSPISNGASEVRFPPRSLCKRISSHVLSFIPPTHTPFRICVLETINIVDIVFKLKVYDFTMQNFSNFLSDQRTMARSCILFYAKKHNVFCTIRFYLINEIIYVIWL